MAGRIAHCWFREAFKQLSVFLRGSGLGWACRALWRELCKPTPIQQLAPLLSRNSNKTKSPPFEMNVCIVRRRVLLISRDSKAPPPTPDGKSHYGWRDSYAYWPVSLPFYVPLTRDSWNEFIEKRMLILDVRYRKLRNEFRIHLVQGLYAEGPNVISGAGVGIAWSA